MGMDATYIGRFNCLSGRTSSFQFPKPMIPDECPVVLSSVTLNYNVVAKDPSPKAPEFSSGR